MGLLSSPLGLAGRGIGALGKGIGGARANAAAVAGDLVGMGPSDLIDERDPDFIRSTLPSNRSLARLLFRPEVRGLDHIPDEGPVLLVGNHSGGTMIIDTFVFSFAFYTHFGPERRFHQLAHDIAVKLPGLSALLRRYGTLPASHDHAEQALEAGAAVLVYPGGDHESFRPSWHSDQVEFGGRSGWVSLALAQDVPIVPVVSIGGQESALFVTRGERLARLLMLDRLLRLKVLPIAIGPPFGLSLLDLPLRLPLPSQVTVQVLPQIDLRERFGDDPDEDEVYEAVTALMQETLDGLSEERDLPLVGRVWSDRAEIDEDEGETEDGEDDEWPWRVPASTAEEDGRSDVMFFEEEVEVVVTDGPAVAVNGSEAEAIVAVSPAAPDPTGAELAAEAELRALEEAALAEELAADVEAAALEEIAAEVEAAETELAAAAEAATDADLTAESEAAPAESSLAEPHTRSGEEEEPAKPEAPPTGEGEAEPELPDPSGAEQPDEAEGTPPGGAPTALEATRVEEVAPLPEQLPPAVPSADDEPSRLVAEVADQDVEEGAGAEVRVDEPWEGYAGMRVRDIADRLAAESDEALAAVALYEQLHKGRKGVLDAIGRERRRR